jgi:tetratricopeptide (TPR) repeat protein
MTILATLTLFVSCARPATPLTVTELLDLGEKYLLELNYEQALVQFLRVIEVEPMNPRGYIGAARAYVGLEQPDSAIAILRQGLELTEDYTIREMLSELEFVEQSDIEVVSETSTPQEPTLTFEPENLSGEEPFAVQDLHDWLFPPGLSFWDVQKILDISDDSIEVFKFYGHQIGFASGLCNNIFIYADTDGMLAGISVVGPSSIIPFGPRNVLLGTNMLDVLMMFKVTNEDAIDFTRAPSYEENYFHYIYGDRDDDGRAFTGRTIRGNFHGTFLHVTLTYTTIGHQLRYEFGLDGFLAGFDVKYYGIDE